MYGKKLFWVFALLVFLGIPLFGDEFNIEDINGIWLTPEDLNGYLSNPYGQGLIAHALAESWYIIRWDKVKKEGFFQIGNDHFSIRSVEIVGKRVTVKYLKKDLYYENKEEIVLEYVSRNLFRILSSSYGLDYDPVDPSGRDYLCRISDFAKKPQAKGRINNYGVRLRNKPELANNVWFYLDFEEELAILGISAEKQTIGELEAYWYEVRITFGYGDIEIYGLDGWVFGAYLDVENRAELEEKLKKLRKDGR